MGKDLNGKEIGKGYSQRKDGRYEARAMINGTKINLYNMNLKELKKEFESAKIALFNDADNNYDKITLKEWYEEWFETCKKPMLKTIQSAKKYNSRFQNTFLTILGDKPIEDIRHIDIQKAANELVYDKSYNGRTVKEALGTMRECLDVAVANQTILTNPCVMINVDAQYTQHERRVLDKKEQSIFLDEAKNSYYYEAYQILLLTGMRIGEFSGLQWGDIDFNKKCIHISRSMSTGYVDGKKIECLTTPKTQNSNRIIPFFGNIEELFQEWQKKQDKYKKRLGKRWRAKAEYGDLVFTSTMGSPVTRYVIVHDINKLVENINLKEAYCAFAENRKPTKFEHLHPHAFRHTFATRCFEKGLEPLFVQSIMGHANYNTTIQYTHITNDKNIEQISKAGELLW